MSRHEKPERIDARERLARAYDAHAPMLYRLALMILGDSAAAEDTVQQAFMKLANLGERINTVRSEEGYLRVAVRNECFRLLGAGREREMRIAQPGPILEPIDAKLTQADELEAIEAALRALPPEQREAVHLKIYEEKSFQEIAELLGISLNTAASRYRYAMTKLRNLLAKFADREA